MSVHQRLIFGYQAGTPTPTDPYFANVTLLLHGNGADGATTTTDSSSYGRAISRLGSAALSTSVKKYGSASMAFASTGDKFYASYSTDFCFGTGDFTVEAWVYLTSYPVADSQVVGLHRYGLDNLWLVYITSAGRVAFYNQAGNGVVGSTETVALNTWTHIAACRSGNTTRCFVQGVQDGSFYDAHNYASYTQNLTIGGDTYGSANAQLTGYVDDLRITKGAARYTSSFTPPAAEFPDS